MTTRLLRRCLFACFVHPPPSDALPCIWSGCCCCANLPLWRRPSPLQCLSPSPLAPSRSLPVALSVSPTIALPPSSFRLYYCTPPAVLWAYSLALTAALQLNIVTFLAKRLFDTTKVAQAGNAGVPFKKVLEEARFLSLPLAKVSALASSSSVCSLLVFVLFAAPCLFLPRCTCPSPRSRVAAPAGSFLLRQPIRLSAPPVVHFSVFPLV